MRDDELIDALADALAPPASEPPPDRLAAFRAEVAAAEPAAPAAPATPLRRRWPLLAAAAVAVVVALIGGTVVATRDDGPSGTLEYAGPIAGDGVAGTLTVTNTGIGRVVELETEDLEILPTGQYYEVWFVGPDDTPESPDRISAGTFHPDEDGRSEVTFAAAVDPTLYPTVQITAEPGDGDPSPTLPPLAEADLSD